MESRHLGGATGTRTIAEHSAHLCTEFGEGGERNLRDSRASHIVSPDREIWHTRVPNLSGSHFRAIMRVADPTPRASQVRKTRNPYNQLPINQLTNYHLADALVPE